MNRLASADSEKFFFFSELRIFARRLFCCFSARFGAAKFLIGDAFFAGVRFFAGEICFETGALGSPEVARLFGLDCGRFNYFSRASSSSGTMR